MRGYKTTMDERDAALTTIPDFIRDMDRVTLRDADTVYLQNQLMDQLYNEESMGPKEISAEDDAAIAKILQEDMDGLEVDKKAVDDVYDLYPRRCVEEPNAKPMSMSSIYSAIRAEVADNTDRGTILGIIDLLASKVTGIVITGVSIKDVDGNGTRYKVALTTLHERIITSEIENIMIEAYKGTWLILFSSPVAVITTTIATTTKKHGIVLYIRRLTRQVTEPTRPTGEPPLSTLALTEILNGSVPYTMTKPLVEMIKAFTVGRDNAHVSSLSIATLCHATPIYTLRVGFNAAGEGITLRRLNAIYRQYSQWHLEIRLFATNIEIDVYPSKYAKYMTWSNAKEIVSQQVTSTQHYSTLLHIIDTLFSGTSMIDDAIRIGIQQLRVKSHGENHYTVSLRIDRNTDISRLKEIDIMSRFNESCMIGFQRKEFPQTDIQGIKMDVFFRHYRVLGKDSKAKID